MECSEAHGNPQGGVKNADFAIIGAQTGFAESERMEAGGFEPPSRDVSRQASTCLVVLLKFRLTLRRATGSGIGYSGKVSRSKPGRPGTLSPLIGALTKPAGTV